MKVLTMTSTARDASGKNAARRTRHAGGLPGVVYGRGTEATAVSLPMSEFVSALASGARVLDLDGLDADQPVRVLLKDVQYDALGANLLHVDLYRVDPSRPIEINLPLELSGVPKGVLGGGILTVLRSGVRIICLPSNIPENVPVDITELELGESIVAADLELPEGVTVAAGEDDGPLIAITVPRGLGSEADEDADGEGDGEEEESEDA